MSSTSADMIRVACAVPYTLDTAPSQRFRWEQWAPLLRKEGVRLDFVSFCDLEIEAARRKGEKLALAGSVARRYPGWLFEMAGTRKADLLVVHRNAALAGPPLVELALHRFGQDFVYDFDDAIYMPPAEADSPLLNVLRSHWRVGSLSKRAALVTVGNQYLADYAARYTARCAIWPTTISINAYAQRPEPRAEQKPVIGWSGSASTAQYLKAHLPFLRALQREQPFKLLVVGAELDLEGVEGECRPWRASEELAALHAIDIGLMPLTDTPWTRGKCALKALQYLAVGTPAVVSDVGVNREAVPDGKAGFVVKSTEAWREALLRLLRDPTLRRRFGLAGREHVRQNFSAEAWVPKIAVRLRQLAMSGQKAA